MPGEWGESLPETQAPGRIQLGDPQIHRDLKVHSAYPVERYPKRGISVWIVPAWNQVRVPATVATVL